MKLTHLLTLCSTMVLAGCSGLSSSDRYGANPLPPVEYNAGELNRETLYELLSAEIAGQRGLFPQALEGYTRQAELTGDAAVAERATRIAQYLREPDQILETSQLWIKSAPDNAEPYQIAAGVLLHQGKFDQALPLLEQALQNNQPQTLALIDSRVTQMPPEALEAYQQLISSQLELTPNSANLHRSNGILLRYQGKIQQALASLNQAARLSPNQLDILVQKADLLRTTGQPRQALAIVNKGQRRYPDNRQLQLLSIQLLFDTKQAGEATSKALKMIEQSPREGQLHLYLALLMMDADRTTDARQVLNQLLDEHPGDSTPEYYLGHLAQRENKREEAIQHYLSVNEGPKLFPAYNRIGALLDSAEHSNRFQEIVADGRALHPQIAMQLYVMEAEWLHLYDLTDIALAVLEDGLKEFPDDISLLYTRAMLVESTDFPQAELDLRKIIAKEPDNALALNALGYLLSIYTERYDEALQLVDKALKLRPEDPATLDSMGWVLFKLKRTSEALEYLERAYEQLPEPEVAGHLVQVYKALGETAKAHALLEKSLKSDPDSSHLLKAAEILGIK